MSGCAQHASGYHQHFQQSPWSTTMFPGSLANIDYCFYGMGHQNVITHFSLQVSLPFPNVLYHCQCCPWPLDRTISSWWNFPRSFFWQLPTLPTPRNGTSSLINVTLSTLPQAHTIPSSVASSKEIFALWKDPSTKLNSPRFLCPMLSWKWNKHLLPLICLAPWRSCTSD